MAEWKWVMTIKLQEVSVLERAKLSNLLELYSYDFSELLDLELGDDGLYGYEHLASYWDDSNRYPYFIFSDEILIGFALIIKGSLIKHDARIWDMSEFFILKKYRRKGLGIQAATELWSTLKGPWQVRVLSHHIEGLQFWEKAIKLSFKNYQIEKIGQPNKEWIVYLFDS